MRKRFFSLITSTLLAFSCFSGLKGSLHAEASEEYQYNGLTYQYNTDGTIDILDCDNDIKNLVIPSEIDGVKVTTIRNWQEYEPHTTLVATYNMLCDKNNLESVVIPDSITTIGGWTFSDCPKLKTCNIPTSVHRIGIGAFNNTPLIQATAGVYYFDNWIVGTNEDYTFTSLTIKEGTVGICGSAFRYFADFSFAADKLSSVILPNSLRYIGESAFEGRTALRSISFPSGVELHTQSFMGTGLQTINFKGTPTKVGYQVFEGTPWLSAQRAKNTIIMIGNILIDGTTATGSVTIPVGTHISKYAFDGNSTMTAVTIGDGTIIEKGAFYGCVALKNVIIGEGGSLLPEYSFCGCSSLELINLPKSLRIIDSSSFAACQALRAIDLPHGLSQINSYAFSHCVSLETVHIPDTVEKIGYNAFSRCIALKHCFLSENLNLIEEETFSECIALESITIPQSVRTIGKRAFEYCRKLSKVIMSEGVERVEERAFQSCFSLSEVELPESCCYIGELAFASEYPTADQIVIPPDGINTSDDLEKIVLNYHDNFTFLTKITILNSNCDIYDSASTITSNSLFIYTHFWGRTYVYEPNSYFRYSGLICGYPDSTAAQYAEKYGYTFESLGMHPLTGDVSLDGDVGLRDAVILARAISGDTTNDMSVEVRKKADMNGDGDINSEDLTLLLRRLAGLEWQ